jgi:hypothetical protein
VGSACAAPGESERELEHVTQDLVADASTPSDAGACEHHPLTIRVGAGQPQLAGGTSTYDILIQNMDVGDCAKTSVAALALNKPADYTMSFFQQGIQLAPQQRGIIRLSATSSASSAPGTTKLQFNILATAQPTLTFSVDYVLMPCTVDTFRELLINDLSVVNDPIRTTFASPNDPRSGAFTFARLMERMAPSAAEAPAMVEKLFNSWTIDQTVNGIVIPKRPAITSKVLDGWKVAGQPLDLTKAPMRLLAIANRFDSRNVDAGHAGEGRFVFGVLENSTAPLTSRNPIEFTIIFEFRMPATTHDQLLAWAKSWHALGSIPRGTEEFNAALQAITDRFTARGAEPARVNGSALSQLRTNEVALGSTWELREFELSAVTHQLEPSTTKQTPASRFMAASDPTLAQYVNQNIAQILDHTYVVPATFASKPFLTGGSINTLGAWKSPAISDNNARHLFSLGTCNGCHGFDETGTGFKHISPRAFNAPAELSSFMKGFDFHDPVTGEIRPFNDLQRRNDDLRSFLCPPTTSRLAATPDPDHGITREH